MFFKPSSAAQMAISASPTPGALPYVTVTVGLAAVAGAVDWLYFTVPPPSVPVWSADEVVDCQTLLPSVTNKVPAFGGPIREVVNTLSDPFVLPTRWMSAGR